MRTPFGSSPIATLLILAFPLILLVPPAYAERDEGNLPAWTAPGPMHRVLDYRVGDWAVTVTFFAPGQVPMEVSARSRQAWTLDGRFLQDETSGDFAGASFRGVGTTGYDAIRGRFTSTWVDNSSTGITVLDGEYDADARVLRWTGEAPQVSTGEYVKERWVERKIDENHWLAECYKTGRDGREYRATVCAYARKDTAGH